MRVFISDIIGMEIISITLLFLLVALSREFRIRKDAYRNLSLTQTIHLPYKEWAESHIACIKRRARWCACRTHAGREALKDCIGCYPFTTRWAQSPPPSDVGFSVYPPTETLPVSLPTPGTVAYR